MRCNCRTRSSIRVARGQAVLVDMSSTGTFVNGVPLGRARLESGGPGASRALEDGDWIRAGDSFFLYRADVSLAPSPVSHGPIGDSPALREVQHTLGLVGPTPATVLVLGETGTGKELAARALHAASGRSGPLVAVNCSAISESLAESQLFGHVAGAFTGAKAAAPGFLRAAAQGTLLLDEVGELPPALQPKLLRALEERRVVPVGATESIAFDARILAATNRDLRKQVDRDRFRADLFARLSEFTLQLPPLRERREDVLPILLARLGAPVPELDPELVEALLAHAWPFNVRELCKVATQLRVRAQGSRRLSLQHFQPHLAQVLPRPEPLAQSPRALDSASAPATGAPGSPETAPGRSEERPAGEREQPPPVPGRQELEALSRRWRGVVADVARETGRSRKQVYRWLELHQLDITRYR